MVLKHFLEFSFKENNIMVGVTLLFTFVSVYLSKKFSGILVIKDFTTLLSGIFFTCFFETIGRAIEAMTKALSKKDWVSYIGTNSLWIYITHMLVLGYFTNTAPIFFLFFVICAIVVAILLAKIYRLFELGLAEIFIRK